MQHGTARLPARVCVPARFVSRKRSLVAPRALWDLGDELRRRAWRCMPEPNDPAALRRRLLCVTRKLRQLESTRQSLLQQLDSIDQAPQHTAAAPRLLRLRAPPSEAEVPDQ